MTPLRDGMNLVAKEFIAAQDEEDPGVLILSRFAGAAAELNAALLVNPHDPEAVGGAIERALTMTFEERRQRHTALFQVISENDIDVGASVSSRHWPAQLARRQRRPSVPNRSARVWSSAEQHGADWPRIFARN